MRKRARPLPWWGAVLIVAVFAVLLYAHLI